MIKIINEITKAETSLTNKELLKVISCIMKQLGAYNSVLDTILPEDDGRQANENNKHEMFEVFRKINSIAPED